jgi:anthranilate synthase component 2
MHGKVSAIGHHGSGVFAGLPNPFAATRYHSLIVERASLPAALTVTAETDGLIMGLAHRERPVHGVQFHPESIASEKGHDLLRNFLTLAARQSIAA